MRIWLEHFCTAATYIDESFIILWRGPAPYMMWRMMSKNLGRQGILNLTTGIILFLWKKLKFYSVIFFFGIDWREPIAKRNKIQCHCDRVDSGQERDRSPNYENCWGWTQPTWWDYPCVELLYAQILVKLFTLLLGKLGFLLILILDS